MGNKKVRIFVNKFSDVNIKSHEFCACPEILFNKKPLTKGTNQKEMSNKEAKK